MTSESKRDRGSSQAAARRPAKRRQGLGDLLAMDSERSSRLMLVGGAVLVLLVAAGFIAFGYWQTVIKPRNRTVLGANGIDISYVAMKRRMSYDLRSNPSFLQSQSAITQLPQIAYSELLREILLITKGPSDQGITIDDKEFDQALRTKIGVAQNADAQTFANALRKALDSSGLHEDEYRRMVRADLIQQKLTAKFTSELPATAPQAKLDVMQFGTKDLADKALVRVRGGEAWDAVAKDLTADPTTGNSSTTIDYSTEGALNSAYSGFAFSAKPGDISDVITAGTGSATVYYVAHLLDRADKPLTATQKPQEAQLRYGQWLDSMQTQTTITNNWDQQSQSDALISVLKSTPAPTAAVPVNVPTTAAQSTPAAGATAGAAPNPQPTGGNNPVAPNAPVAPGGGSAP